MGVRPPPRCGGLYLLEPFRLTLSQPFFLTWLFVADGVGEGLAAFGREEACWGRLGQAGDDFFVANGAEEFLGAFGFEEVFGSVGIGADNDGDA